MFTHKNRIICVAIVATALAAVLIVAGCAPKSAAEKSTSASAASTASAAADTASAQYASTFPLEYNSLHATWTDAEGRTIGHTVENLRDICEAPLMRDMNGDVLSNDDGTNSIAGFHYDATTKQYVIDQLTDKQLEEYGLYSGCVACKSSKFKEIYQAKGAAAFTTVYNEEAKSIINDDYFDCGLCHEGTPSASTVKANSMYWNALGEGLMEKIPAGDAVCAQCHNSYDYRSSITQESDLQNDRPYKNGYDIDGLMKTCLEDGTNFDTDEDTGIMESYLTHPDIELFMGTKMQQMGVTCTDCHMAKSTDTASGMTYTNHSATGSPLENEDALNYCLSCHKDQGINSTSEMVTFVRGKQAALADAMTALEGKEALFKTALEAAVTGSTKDAATLEAAKALYAQVTWYDCCLVSGPYEESGAKVAMMDGTGIVTKAAALCDQGLALLN